jgi:hypothetical protein
MGGLAARVAKLHVIAFALGSNGARRNEQQYHNRGGNRTHHDPNWKYCITQGDRQASIAGDNSSTTDASVSTDTRDDSADLASAEPNLPSAQAACARTNGSASDNAPRQYWHRVRRPPVAQPHAGVARESRAAGSP